MAERTRNTSKRRTDAKKSQAEEVEAQEIQVGDLIWFPNSRKAQEVTGVAVENQEVPGQDEPRQIIRLSAEGVTWNLNSDYKVRRG